MANSIRASRCRHRFSWCSPRTTFRCGARCDCCWSVRAGSGSSPKPGTSRWSNAVSRSTARTSSCLITVCRAVPISVRRHRHRVRRVCPHPCASDPDRARDDAGSPSVHASSTRGRRAGDRTKGHGRDRVAGCCPCRGPWRALHELSHARRLIRPDWGALAAAALKLSPRGPMTAAEGPPPRWMDTETP